MTKFTTAALIALVAKASASPVANSAIKARSDVCSYTSFPDSASVQAAYDDIGSIDQLDIFLGTLANHETKWVDALYTLVFKDDGLSSLTGCGQMGSDCTIAKSCQDFVTAGLGPQYLTFTAVQRLHSKLNTMYSQLNMNGWAASLKISSISADFGLPSVDSDWPDYISQAFSLATLGLDGVPEVAGTMMDFMVDGLKDATTVEDGDANDPTAAVESALSDIVQSAASSMSSILSTATGSGGTTSDLPIYTDSTLEYPVARFFNDPSLLVDEDAENATFTAAWSSFNTNVEKKLVDLALGVAYYVLAGDAATTEAACSGTGDRWLSPAGTAHCFHFISPGASVSTCSDNDVTTCDGQSWNVVDDDFYTKLTSYGFDIDDYYNSLISCHSDSSDCFYDVPVKKATVKAVGTGGDTTMLLSDDLS